MPSDAPTKPAAATGGPRVDLPDAANYRSRSTVVVPRTDTHAFKLLRQGRLAEGFGECLQAAYAGDSEARTVAAWMELTRTDRAGNIELAEQWLDEGRRNGSLFATYGLAWLKRKIGERAVAYQLMLTAAGKGFPAAVLDLGRFYENGIGTLIDLRLAEMQYVAAARSGHAMGYALLLQLWSKGANGPAKAWVGRLMRWPVQWAGSILTAMHRFDERGLVYGP